MASIASKPARVARGTGFGNVSCWAASDFPKDKPELVAIQAAWLVRHRRISPAVAASVATLAFGGLAR